MSATISHSTTITKRIAYNPATKDYDCFLTVNGVEQPIGSKPTYHDAEVHCDHTAHDVTFDLPPPDPLTPATIAEVDALITHVHGAAAPFQDTQTQTIVTAVTTRVTYNPATHAYDCVLGLNGAEQPIGAQPTYREAEAHVERAARDLVGDLLTAYGLPTAARITYDIGSHTYLCCLTVPLDRATDGAPDAVAPAAVPGAVAPAARLRHALARCGLTDDQRADLLSHITDLCGAAASDAYGAGYGHGYQDGRVDARAARIQREAA